MGLIHKCIVEDMGDLSSHFEMTTGVCQRDK